MSAPSSSAARAISRLAVAPLLAASLLLASSCGRAPAVDYHVAIADTAARAIDVTASIRDVPRDSVVVRGFAPPHRLRVSALSAVDARGRVIAIRATADSSGAPHFVLGGPLEPPLVLRWRVDPDVREGDAHVGWTGVREG